MPQAPLTYWAIVPATGIGSRMQSDRPKQYLKLGSKTILELTLDNLLSHGQIAGAVLVLNEQDQYWSELGFKHDKTVFTCSGGQQRYHSVLNGLRCLREALNQDAVVLIHDAVRPFVQHADLDRLIEVAGSSDDGAILAAPVTDTLKVGGDDDRIQSTRTRDNLWRAFTPQAFRLELIEQALNTVVRNRWNVTDDASAMEQMGYRPRLVSCDSRNIKITHPDDLRLAEHLFSLMENGRP